MKSVSFLVILKLSARGTLLLNLKSFLGIFFSVLLFCVSARAESPVYTVDVSVDVTDVNAAQAREKAMVAANRKAFETVVQKITTAQGAKSLMNFSNEQILNFIKEVSVVSEKSSNVRYIADLKVTVNENILKRYMNEKDVRTVVEAASNVVIIPVFREYPSDKPLLWEDNNSWRFAWENKAPRNSLVKISSVPANTISFAAIDAQKALAFNSAALEEIALNNNANDVYVADAVYDGIEGLTVHLSSLKKGSGVETINVAGDRNQSAELMTRAVDEVSAKIENKVKVASIAENQMMSSIEVVYNFVSLKDWVATEKVLKSIAYVRNLQVEAMGAGKVQFKLEFVGADDKIWAALRSYGLNLKKYDSFYLLEK